MVHIFHLDVLHTRVVSPWLYAPKHHQPTQKLADDGTCGANFQAKPVPSGGVRFVISSTLIDTQLPAPMHVHRGCSIAPTRVYCTRLACWYKTLSICAQNCGDGIIDNGEQCECKDNSKACRYCTGPCILAS